jgi:hypothetical protein
MKKGLKVGKHNALSGNTASGRMGPSYDGEYYTATLRLAMWHQKPQNFRAYIYIQTHTSCPPSRGFVWRINCGVEVTEWSTNKQHTLSLAGTRGPRHQSARPNHLPAPSRRRAPWDVPPPLKNLEGQVGHKAPQCCSSKGMLKNDVGHISMK